MDIIAPPRKKGRDTRRESGYLFIMPALLFVLILTIYPTYRIVNLSLHELDRANNTEIFVGLKNYTKILNDPVFRMSFKQTLMFTGFGAIGHMGLGFFLALIMNSKLNRTVMGVSRALILIPWILSPTVIAILTQLWAHPLISPIAKVLHSLGWNGVFEPLGNPETALFTLIFMNVWQYTPFYMLMILAGLQTMDMETHNAAKIDGANSIQILYYIIWPHIRNVVLTFTLFDLVANAAYFDLIWVATKGGPVRSTEVMATYMYRRAFLSLNWNESSVVAVVLLLLSLFFSVFIISRMRKE